MDAREPLDPVGLRLATSTGASSGRSQTGLPLEMTCAEGAAERQAFFEAVERGFAWQAHAMTLLAGDTGFYMVRSVSNDLAQAATGRARMDQQAIRTTSGGSSCRVSDHGHDSRQLDDRNRRAVESDLRGGRRCQQGE